MARKRLNKNMVIGLTLFVFAAMIAVSALMLHQLRMGDPRHFLNLARRYEAEEKWRQAALFYQKAAQRSRDAAHLVSLGDMLLRDGEVRQALQVWRGALIDQPDLIDAHVRKLEVLLELATLYGGVPSWLDVQEAAESLLDVAEAQAAEQTATARHALGMALLHLRGQDPGHAEKGLAELRQACDLAPGSVDFALDLAGELIRQQLLDEGEELYRRLLEEHREAGPESAKVRRVYAAQLAEDDRFDEATELFEEALSLAPAESRALHETRLEYARFLSRRWAQAMSRNKDSAVAEETRTRAESLLRACIAFDPEDFDPYVQLATLTKAAGRDQQTVEIARQRLDAGLSRKGIKALRRKLRAFQLMLLASEACVALSIQAVDEPDLRDEWLAKASRYVDDAKGEFLNDARALAQSARVLRAAGQDRAALEEFRNALAGFRASGVIDWRATLDTARLHLLLNEPGAALSLLEEVADRATTSSFWVLYAQALFKNDEVTRALTIAEQILNTDPDQIEAKRIKAAVYDRQGRGVQAAHLTESPVIRAMLEAREHALDGDRDGAIAVLQRALREHPADLRLVQVTVQELLSLQRWEEARSAVDAAVASDPDSVALRKLAVLVQPDLPDEERDRRLLEIVQSEKDPYQRAWDLIDYHARRKNLRDVLDAIGVAEEHFLQRDTPSARQATVAQQRALLQVKLRAAAELDDSAAMEAARDAAVRYNVDGAQGQSFVAMYHLYREEYELAIRAFRRTVEEQPSDVRTLTRLGQCLQHLERPDEARMYFERALRINRNDPWAHRGLAMLAKQAGDQATYEAELALCEKRMPSDPWVRAELLARQEQADPAGAIARREALLAENPEDSANLRRLARLCETIGHLEQADDYSARLVQLHPDDQSVIAAVAKYYRRTHRPEMSLALVTEFVESRTTPADQAEARIIQAAHHLAQGEPDRVEATLLAAADQANSLEVSYGLGEFYLRTLDRPDKALPWFDKAVQFARETDTSKLPKILAARIACLLHRALNDLPAARTRADELTRAFPDDPLSYLWQSEVSAREGEIDQAVSALSEYLDRNPDAAYPRFQRAQYYLVQGRTGPAIEDLETLKQLDRSALKGKPRLLLARLHHRAGRRGDAIRELESLVQDLPHSLEAHELLVSAYLEDDRYDEADRLVTAKINQAGEEPDPRWLFLRGQIALKRDDYDRAYGDFHRAVGLSEYSPESLLLILELHLRSGRFSEGVEYYRQYSARDRRTAALVARYAHVLARSKQIEESIEAFGQAMDLALAGDASDVRQVTNELAAAFGAEAAFGNDAIKLFESHPARTSQPESYNRILVRLYRMADRNDEAADLLEQSIRKQEPGRALADLLVEQAELFQARGDVELARARYEEALTYDDRNWVALNNVAYLLSDALGQNELALPYARRAVAIRDSADTLDTLGWIYVALGDYALAVAELSRAIRLAPEAALSYYHLGEAFRRLGRFADAGRTLEQGRELAQQAKKEALRELIDAALEKVARSDRAS